jgi:hypothetical protein
MRRIFRIIFVECKIDFESDTVTFEGGFVFEKACQSTISIITFS